MSVRRWLTASSRSSLNAALVGAAGGGRVAGAEHVLARTPTGRVWKYGSAAGSAGTGSIPISDEPTGGAVRTGDHRALGGAGEAG